MSFSIIMIIKKIFSVILRLSNNTKYLRPGLSKGHFFFCFERNKENNKKIQKINRKIRKYLENLLTFN